MKTRQHVTLNPLRTAVQWMVVALLCVAINLTQVRAQGFVPGTPVDNGLPLPEGSVPGIPGISGTLGAILGNLGPISSAWGAITGIFEGEFSITKLFDAACASASAANSVSQSTGNPGGNATLKADLCGLSTFARDVETRGENIEDVIVNFGKGMFSSVAEAASTLGLNVTPDQALQFQTQMTEILNGEPEEIPQAMLGLFQDNINTRMDNIQSAPDGTSDAVLRDTMALAPNLALQQAEGYVEQGQALESLGQGISNSMMSVDLATRQSQDTTLEKQSQSVTEVTAPMIRQQANAAVSTRATVQEVVNAITRYMEQDAYSQAFLNEQLVNSSQQQAYTNHQLYLIAQSMYQDNIKQSQEKQAKAQQALFATKQALEMRTNQLAATLGSFGLLGNDTDTNIGIYEGTLPAPIITLTQNTSLMQDYATPVVDVGGGTQ